MSFIIVLSNFVLKGLCIFSIVDALSTYPVDRNTSQVRDIVTESSRDMGGWGVFVEFRGMKVFVE
jgi:hypothetical protein